MYKATLQKYLEEKEKEKKISKNTAKNYISSFNTLQTLFKTDNLKYIKNPDETIKVIEKEYTNNQTIQAKINIILLLIKLFYKGIKQYDEYYEIYDDYINKIRGNIITEYNKHEPTLMQVERALTKEENDKIITTLLNNVKYSIKTVDDLLALRNYLIYMILETMPIRGDFANSVFILENINNKYEENINYFVLDKQEKKVIYLQQNYKTKKKNGTRARLIDSNLYRFFVKLYNYYNNKLKIKEKHIFYQNDCITALNADNLSKIYKNIGISIINKPLSLQVNRVQNASEDGGIIEYLNEKAEAQNHSLNTHVKIYYKKNMVSKKS